MNGVRRTITLPPELDEQLAILGVKRRIPVSVILQEIIAKGLDAMSAGRDGHRAKADIPAGWDGGDLQNRLHDLHLLQTRLAEQLGVHKSTLGSWINGTHPWPEGMLEQIRQALVSWDPEEHKFRWGSKTRKP